MKKFSWIFALILALSLAFIGCPADSDDGDGGSSGGDGGSSYTKNPGAKDFTVNFSATGTGTITSSVASVKILKDGDNSGPIDPGTLTYITNGYRYAYGTANNSNYGNAILRFKINLGKDDDGNDIVLADYGKISFDWIATAPSPYADNNSINSNKYLFLYATDTEDNITPWAEPKELIVSTKVLDDHPSWGYYNEGAPKNSDLKAADPNIPVVNGLTAHHIEMPIIVSDKTEYLGGNVWLAIYVHSEKGTYEITNVKFWAGNQTLACDPAGPAAPPQPPEIANIPADFVEIPLNLAVANVSDTGTSAINATLPTGLTAVGSGIKATFGDGTDTQRLNVKLSSTDITAFQANLDAKDVYVQIDYEINGTAGTDGKYAGDSFRYHVGKIDTNSSWNATDSLNAFALEDIAISDTGKGIKLNASAKDRAAYFIIQHRSATAITVTFKSISLWVAPAPALPPFEVVFNPGAGTPEVTGLGDGVVNAITAAGFTVETFRESWSTDAPMGAVYFKVKLPDGVTLGDYSGISLTYTGVAGDTGYKRPLLNISKTVPTAADIKNFADTGDGAIARTDTNDGANRNIGFAASAHTRADLLAPFLGESEVYFIISIWSTAAEYTITNIKLYSE